MSESDKKQAPVAKPDGTADAVLTGIERGFDRVASSRIASLIVLLLVTLACFLPGFAALHPIDRDEARFVQATKQMLETGDFINIRLQDEQRNKKPAGIHWLQAIAAGLSGEGAAAPIWIYRLPSLIGAVIAVFLTWWVALAFGPPRVALLAGLLIAGSTVLGVEARLATTDAVLLACILASVGVLARVWLADGTPTHPALAALFWAGLALGILVKGPVAPMLLVLLTVLLVVQRGSAAWLLALRPKAGLIGLLVAVLPWFIAITISTKGAFLSGAVGHDLWSKVVSAQERHGAPPGTYLLIFFLTFWPGAAYVSLSMPWVVTNMRRPAVIFAIAWAVPFWLVFELLQTKLPHYVLPAYPALALAAALALDAGAVHARGWIGWLFSLGPLVIPILIAIGVPVSFYVLERHVPVLGTVALVAGAAIGAWGWEVLVRRDKALASLLITLVAAMVIYEGVYQLILPNMEKLRISGRLAALGQEVADCAEPAFVAAGYGEPSLVFLLGTKTRLTDGAGAADFLGQDGCQVAIVESREIPQFLERAEDLGFNTVQRGQASGFNISNGHRVEFALFERQAGETSRRP